MPIECTVENAREIARASSSVLLRMRACVRGGKKIKKIKSTFENARQVAHASCSEAPLRLAGVPIMFVCVSE